MKNYFVPLESHHADLFEFLADEYDLSTKDIARSLIGLADHYFRKAELNVNDISMVPKLATEMFKHDLETLADQENRCPNCFSENFSPVFEKQLAGEFWGTPAYEEVEVSRQCHTCGEVWDV